jgi:hypothetical protein
VKAAANGDENAEVAEVEITRDIRPASRLRALNGASDTGVSDSNRPPPLPASEAEDNSVAKSPSRRPRLLERISGIDKS